jgi:hypothetical protein
MLIDPVTALGIAGNVIQFVDFASKLVSKGSEYYGSIDGALLEHTELSGTAERLRKLSRGLETSMRLEQLSQRAKPGDLHRKYSLAEQGLLEVNHECCKLAEEFCNALEELRISDKHRRWESFCQAFKTLWSEEKIEILSKRLGSATQQLIVHLLVYMR